MKEFSDAWNNHPLHTDYNWTPSKIWTNSVIREELDGHVAEIEWFGVDKEGPLTGEQQNTVVVPETCLGNVAFMQHLNNINMASHPGLGLTRVEKTY